MLLFYENLHKRQEQIDKFRTKEGIKVNMEFDPLTTLLTYQNVNQFLTIKSLKPPPPPPVVPEVPAVVTPSTRADSRPSRRGSAAVTTPASAAASSAVGTAASNDSGDDFFRPDDVAALSSRVESARAKTPTRAASRAATPAVRVLDSWDEVEALGGPSQHLIEGFEAEDPADGAEGSRPTTQGENTAAAAHMHDAFNAAETGIKLDEYMRRYVCVMASSNVQPQAKAARTLELLVNTFEYHFIYARHLELMCEIFEEFGQIPCSEYFGTYRVELVISLFACVVDLHNFEIVMRRLTPFEAGCVTCRLGWLHLYNPMKPEGTYSYGCCVDVSCFSS